MLRTLINYENIREEFITKLIMGAIVAGEGKYLNIVDDQSLKRPIDLAALAGNFHAFKTLLDCGASLDVDPNHPETTNAFYWVTAKEDHRPERERIVRLFLERNLYKNIKGLTKEHVLAALGEIEYDILIEMAKANKLPADSTGLTALHYYFTFSPMETVPKPEDLEYAGPAQLPIIDVLALQEKFDVIRALHGSYIKNLNSKVNLKLAVNTPIINAKPSLAFYLAYEDQWGFIENYVDAFSDLSRLDLDLSEKILGLTLPLQMVRDKKWLLLKKMAQSKSGHQIDVTSEAVMTDMTINFMDGLSHADQETIEIFRPKLEAAFGKVPTLKQNSNVNEEDSDDGAEKGLMELHNAVYFNKLDDVAWWVDSQQVNPTQIYNDITAIEKAVQLGRLEILDYLASQTKSTLGRNGPMEPHLLHFALQLPAETRKPILEWLKSKHTQLGGNIRLEHIESALGVIPKSDGARCHVGLDSTDYFMTSGLEYVSKDTRKKFIKQIPLKPFTTGLYEGVTSAFFYVKRKNHNILKEMVNLGCLINLNEQIKGTNLSLAYMLCTQDQEALFELILTTNKNLILDFETSPVEDGQSLIEYMAFRFWWKLIQISLEREMKNGESKQYYLRAMYKPSEHEKSAVLSKSSVVSLGHTVLVSYNSLSNRTTEVEEKRKQQAASLITYIVKTNPILFNLTERPLIKSEISEKNGANVYIREKEYLGNSNAAELIYTPHGRQLLAQLISTQPELACDIDLNEIINHSPKKPTFRTSLKEFNGPLVKQIESIQAKKNQKNTKSTETINNNNNDQPVIPKEDPEVLKKQIQADYEVNLKNKIENLLNGKLSVQSLTITLGKDADLIRKGVDPKTTKVTICFKANHQTHIKALTDVLSSCGITVKPTYKQDTDKAPLCTYELKATVAEDVFVTNKKHPETIKAAIAKLKDITPPLKKTDGKKPDNDPLKEKREAGRGFLRDVFAQIKDVEMVWDEPSQSFNITLPTTYQLYELQDGQMVNTKKYALPVNFVTDTIIPALQQEKVAVQYHTETKQLNIKTDDAMPAAQNMNAIILKAIQEQGNCLDRISKPTDIDVWEKLIQAGFCYAKEISIRWDKECFVVNLNPNELWHIRDFRNTEKEKTTEKVISEYKLSSECVAKLIERIQITLGKEADVKFDENANQLMITPKQPTIIVPAVLNELTFKVISENGKWVSTTKNEADKNKNNTQDDKFVPIIERSSLKKDFTLEDADALFQLVTGTNRAFNHFLNTHVEEAPEKEKEKPVKKKTAAKKRKHKNNTATTAAKEQDKWKFSYSYKGTLLIDQHDSVEYFEQIARAINAICHDVMTVYPDSKTLKASDKNEEIILTIHLANFSYEYIMRHMAEIKNQFTLPEVQNITDRGLKPTRVIEPQANNDNNQPHQPTPLTELTENAMCGAIYDLETYGVENLKAHANEIKAITQDLQTFIGVDIESLSKEKQEEYVILRRLYILHLQTLFILLKGERINATTPTFEGWRDTIRHAYLDASFKTESIIPLMTPVIDAIDDIMRVCIPCVTSIKGKIFKSETINGLKEVVARLQQFSDDLAQKCVGQHLIAEKSALVDDIRKNQINAVINHPWLDDLTKKKQILLLCSFIGEYESDVAKRTGIHTPKSVYGKIFGELGHASAIFAGSFDEFIDRVYAACQKELNQYHPPLHKIEGQLKFVK